ncbi:double-strand break repair helicase AddA [Altererythrobacter sp. BO-6]|uniref:double-strand break repair helicase AddA n=1 Tax=Altererythrobacter sp. BO-6 TaxID=2604537 RepID=UPI0013E1E158|nr:double-strand break repair helicase AddA [Altererythrobacter sp. BO-6]QIG53115.1 double-strand break repair helicase AddA [Altererythrobacter sp. BO-6]
MSSGEVYPLVGNQQGAADPEESVWLSASAGTGKTQVISARVLRLLLRPDVQPEQILCLTFTKAGAAEMAVRINAVLARWVRIDEGRLGKELIHLGASNDHETRARARTLFASVLDCSGGGLRIDTIHAFSQWLLANFPEEAGLMPGMRPMEDRERHLLSRQVLGDMLVEAEQAGDRATLEAVERFTIAKGADALQAWLMRCAKARELWFGRRGWQPPMAPQVKQLLGIPSDASEAHLAEMCDNYTFDTASLLRCQQTLSAWDTATGREGSAAIEVWLARDPLERARTIDELYDGLFTKTTDAPKQLKNILKRDPEYGIYIDKVQENIRLIRDFRTLLELADFLTPALELGRAFALRWDEAKAREGLLDFDDLIERAASLLKEQVAGDWIRFKLDRQFDHILVDEAQDTNEAQWRIIDALIDDFFAGEGAAGDKVRTIFTVGDTKQAIFGFQGTSPENFQRAKERVAAAMDAANANAAAARINRRQRELRDLDLGQSFRTAIPVLEFVDRAIAAIGPGDMGLTDGHHPHVGQDRPGLVTLWNPVHDERGQEGDDPEEEGQENWLARHDRKLAEKIATQVARWTKGAEPFALQKGTHRNARPGDIMVLVRSRKELAGLIVARLHAKGVPVAGVDRLRLGEPLAVKDLMSALRFAVQPLDDLELANLLSSPLVGWSQDDLLAHVPRAKGKRLWHHLREHADPFVQATVARLRELLALADFETPQALLQWLLVGPWQGRAKLVARLGREANDPIDELLNAAFGYEASHTASLAGFIQWFDAGEGELKRDPDDAPDLVRVMTVHGSKGLQAPIVILADATSAPGKVRDVELAEQAAGQDLDDARKVPMPSLGKEMQIGRVADAYEAAKEAELQEHWRLLYVAMTRAEEALFIGGSLGPKARNGPHEDSWYARLAPLFGENALGDDLWRARREWGERAPPVAAQTEAITPEKLAEPAWLRRPIGPEPRPPRPLAPSSAGEEQGSDPPLPPEVAREAARRGVLIHALLERLPDLAPSDRPAAAARWLERQARELDEAARQEIAARALEVLAQPDLAEVFSHASLAEVPLAATVDGVVIAGIADRLLVTPEQVTVVDYKTARRPPARLEDIPESTLRQMAAYVAALEVIYPGRTVRAAIVYTQTPQIFELPQELVGLHKNAFQSAQQSYATSPVE